MKFIKNFIQRYKNARLAVKQLRNNEWKLADDHENAHKYRLSRGNIGIWIANGVWYCDTRSNHKDLNHFGLFWRHYVWWFGVVPFLKRNKPKEDKSVPVLE